ncbi:hypothetical protein BDV98DRAFT_568080 [Pterulicium gracile]|uniref:Arrestin-like N-terminal domain-containing protein n=1 Tax=Pterulicium gracile TaxID=1884261 RepID=A0A5C3QH83_9AGAR|nr:hypothetical protein BDV98DRAFT_568080 [Pterula gracilis]
MAIVLHSPGMDRQSIQPAPEYTSSAPAPPYSADPQPSERRLNISPRSSQRYLTRGNVIVEHKHATVVFQNQGSDRKTPSFGANSLIDGVVSAHGERDSITRVDFKLQGSIQVTNAVNGLRKQTISQVHTLFQHTEGEICPSEIPFAIPFPTKYTDVDKEHNLPPSFCSGLDAMTSLSAKCHYTVLITIYRHSWHFLPKTKSIRIPVRYYPRSRPPRPPLFSRLLPSVKVQPDEWMQISSTIQTRDGSGLQPLQCHFFIPSVQIFTLSRAIPFHIQVSGPCSSIRELFGSASKFQEPIVSVKLMRQVIVDLMGEKSWRNIEHAHGDVRALPPPMTCGNEGEGCGCDTVFLDWEGEVRSADEVSVGGFNSGALIVRDFLQLEIAPAHQKSSKILPSLKRQVIKLVTDPFEDDQPEGQDAWMI